MRKTLKSSILAIGLAMMPLVSLATPTPSNQERMSSLQYLIGTWNCDWQSGSKSGSEQQVFKPALDGAWLEEKEIVEKDDHPMVRSIHYTGYDPVAKMFVHVGPDAGGSYELARSPDAIHWSSDDGSFVHRKISDTKRTMSENDNATATLAMTCTKM